MCSHRQWLRQRRLSRLRPIKWIQYPMTSVVESVSVTAVWTSAHNLFYYRPQTKFGARLCFSTCVWFCSKGGVSTPLHAGIHPSLLGRHTPLRILWDMVNKWVVRILLECILLGLGLCQCEYTVTKLSLRTEFYPHWYLLQPRPLSMLSRIRPVWTHHNVRVRI